MIKLIFFWACPCENSLRLCPQGRRATGYMRNAPTIAQKGAHPKEKSHFSKPNLKYLGQLPRQC
ncbi:MAG: hypothetical protein NZ519_04555 [Bacteroidia bacterium]|nr:hypothetical protein [Bacteroidia bacterium]MDW8301090.1 hypothetical protein [Bacteroidia bacterium]